jgi:hypothetical protein
VLKGTHKGVLKGTQSLGAAGGRPSGRSVRSSREARAVSTTQVASPKGLPPLAGWRSASEFCRRFAAAHLLAPVLMIWHDALSHDARRIVLEGVINRPFERRKVFGCMEYSATPRTCGSLRGTPVLVELSVRFAAWESSVTRVTKGVNRIASPLSFPT